MVEEREIVDPESLQIRHGQEMLLEVNPFPSMCHMTLQWSGADRLVRREIEADLAKRLSEMESPPNPAGMWLMSIAGILLGAVCFCLLLLILFSVFVIFSSS